MDIKKAAKELRGMLSEINLIASPPEFKINEYRNHLVKMLDRIEGELEDDFGQPVVGEKAHRWLAYVQCALHFNGYSLAALKLVNKQS